MEVLSAENTDTVLDLLKALHPLWHHERERRKNTAPKTEYFIPSGDHAVESDWQKYARKMDDLLEDFFSQNVTLEAIEGVDYEPIISDYAAKVQEDGRGIN